MRIKIFLLIISITFLQTGCIPYDFSRKYAQQGNLLSKKRINRLQIGMSKEDVSILMGTSLVSPLFSMDRWDYAYTWRKANHPLLVRHLVLYFKNNRLVHIEKSQLGQAPVTRN